MLNIIIPMGYVMHLILRFKSILFVGGVVLISTTVLSQVRPLDPPNIVWITSEDNSKHYMALFDENGIQTPHIKRLAEHGITFTRAFSNGPVCSVARSTLIAGSYAPRIGAQFHRKIQQVPMPDGLYMFPYYLRNAGYYTTNRAKEDYNQFKQEGVWDESSNKANWRNRADGQPFFHVHNIGTTHESRLFFSEGEMEEALASAPEDSFYIHPYHPQTRTFYYTNLRYRSKILEMDQEVGQVIDQLEADGLLSNTFIFYFGDHGGVLPGSKGYLKEIGLHVPLVMYIPARYEDLGPYAPGSQSDAFVSFIDFGPTVLHLAGVDVPEGMDGRPIWGQAINTENLQSRQTAFGYADRFDEKYDLVRSVRKANLKYIRNFQPYHPDALWNNYRYKQLGYQEWKQMFLEGKLNQTQAAFFQPKAAEELYDLTHDPFETRNLANDPAYHSALHDLRGILNTWMLDMPDLSLYPEYYLIQAGAMEDPVTFGQDHQNQIKTYFNIANLMLEDMEKGEKKLKKSLRSKDPISRYWAMNVCLHAGQKAKKLVPQIEQIASGDDQLINRVLANAWLGLHQSLDLAPALLSLLYQSRDATETLLMLNEIVWLRDVHHFEFLIDPMRLPEEVRTDMLVQNRLSYLAS